MKLVNESAESELFQDQEITDLVGTGTAAGKSLTLVFTGATQTMSTEVPKGVFALKDSNGALVASASDVPADTFLETNYFTDASGNNVLGSSVYIKSVSVDVKTATPKAVLVSGKNILQLKNNREYPYNAASLDSQDDYWVFNFGTINNTTSTPDVNVIKEFSISNSKKLWDYTLPIWAPKAQCLTSKCEAGINEAKFLEGVAETTPGYNYLKLSFDGFKRESVSYSTLKIGDGYVNYSDNSDFQHKIPFYLALPISSSVTTESNFTIDSQTFVYRINDNAQEFILGTDNNTLNGINTRVSSANAALSDYNLLFDDGNSGVHLPAGVATTIDINGLTGSCTRTAATNNIACTVDGNIQIAKATNFTTADSDTATYYIGNNNLGKTWFYEKADVVTDMNNMTAKGGNVWAAIPLTGAGMEDKIYYYTPYRAHGSYQTLYLLLNKKTTTESDGAWNTASIQKQAYGLQLNGTDTDLGGGTAENLVVDQPFYVPDIAQLTANEAQPDHDYYVATFTVDPYVGSGGTASYNTNVYIDTGVDNKLIAYPNNNLAGYSVDVNYGPNTWTLSNNTLVTALKKGYTDESTKFDITGGIFTLEAPNNTVYIKYSVVSAGATTVLSGTPCTPAITAKDGTCKTSTGTEVTLINDAAPVIAQVKYTAGCTADQLEVANVTANKVVAAGDLVTTAEDVFAAGNHIIVGGYLVNTLAKAATVGGASLEEVLTADNAVVVEATDDGDYVVAGYTAADTVDAAKQFIAELDALLE